MPSIIADRRLFLNADKSAVVESDNPAAAFLLVAEGSEIDPVQVARHQLVSRDGKVVIPDSKPASAKKK